jgi:hypothetical protein
VPGALRRRDQVARRLPSPLADPHRAAARGKHRASVRYSSPASARPSASPIRASRFSPSAPSKC